MNGNDDGWIKIHRSIWKNPWMYRPNVLMVWMYILCHVNYQPTDAIFEGKRITLEPGQGIFKIRQIASELKIPLTSVHRIVETLKNETQIETQTSPRNTIITVVNWSKYQLRGTQNETQVEHKWNTNGTQTANLPIKNKEYKELKKEKENPKEKDFAEVIKLYDERFPCTITSYKATQLNDLVDVFGKDAVLFAIKTAYANHTSNIKFIRTTAMNEARRRENNKEEPTESQEEIGARMRAEAEKRRREGKSKTFEDIKRMVEEKRAKNGTGTDG